MSRWQVSPHFWVRSAGLPFDWIEGLVAERTLAVLEDDASAGSGPPDAERLRAAFDADLMTVRRRLAERLADPMVQEAVFLSNRDAFARIRAVATAQPTEPPNKKYRQRLRLAWNYLQRFCAKNDTASFFGPIVWGRIDPAVEHIEADCADVPWLRTRSVFFEHWAVQALADSISEDPGMAPYLPLRLHPGCRLDDRMLRLPGGRRVALSEPVASILSRVATGAGAVDQVTLLQDLGAREGMSPDALQAEIDGLLRRKVLSRRLLLATVDPRPERQLAQALAALPSECRRRGDWAALIEELWRLRSRFETAGLEQRIVLAEAMQQHFAAAATAGSMQRRAGEAYVGRYVFYEDCERNARIDLGPKLLESARPTLDLALDAYRQVALRLGGLLHARYLSLYREQATRTNGELDFLSFHQAAGALDLAAVEVEMRAAISSAWAQAEADEGVEELQLSPAVFRRIVEALAPPQDDGPGPGVLSAVHSPDLLLAADSLEALAAGRYMVVIGEVHPCVHSVAQPVARPFCPDRREIDAEVAALLAPSTMVLVDPPSSYQRSNINWPDCPSLHEIVVPGAASRLPPERQVPVGMAAVVEDRGRLYVTDLRNGRRCELLTAMPGQLHRLLFRLAPQVLGGGLAPRLVCGRVMIKRRTWTARAEELPAAGDEALQFAACRGWARRRGLPRHVFFKAAAEPKPFYLDFDNPFAVDAFARELQRSGTLSISEMRPAPHELWLRDRRGRFTSEFRTTWVRSRGD